jgi:hypothetical protein
VIIRYVFSPFWYIVSKKNLATLLSTLVLHIKPEFQGKGSLKMRKVMQKLPEGHS